MTDLRAVLRTTLEGDSAFASPLTGGIYDESELPEEGLNPSQTPGAFDLTTGEIKPCAIIHWRDFQPYGPHFEEGSERGYVEIYVYQQTGVDVIETAAKRAVALLNRARMTAADYGLCWLNMVHRSRILRAQELGGARALFVRFEITRVR
jgi:hypothetical protein